MSSDGVRAVSKQKTPSAIVWSVELAQALTPYLEAAETHRAAGRVEEAVATWEAALRDVPGVPAPRRQAVLRRIRDASLRLAQSAVKARPPDWRRAAAWLARWLRWAEGAGDDEKRRVLLLRAMALHMAGDRDAALRCYEEAAPDGFVFREETDAWRYGAALLRLQLAVAGSAGRGAAPSVEGENVPSHKTAWQRLQALERLLAGDAEAAAAAFPKPDAAGLPGSWALEGGVLAALARQRRLFSPRAGRRRAARCARPRLAPVRFYRRRV